MADGGTWLTVDVGSDDLVTAIAGIVTAADAIEDAGGLVGGASSKPRADVRPEA